MSRRKVEVRRDEILRATVEEVTARGFASTRVADVAARLGISTGLVFYHFDSKEGLLSQAFAYAAEQDLATLDDILASRSRPLAKLRAILRVYAPTGTSKAWAMWIDGWAEAMRVPELEAVSRRLDLRWKEAVTEVIVAGVESGAFTCDDPSGAAWRLIGLIDGLSVQVTVHRNVISRRALTQWVRLAAARELGLTPAQLA